MADGTMGVTGRNSCDIRYHRDCPDDIGSKSTREEVKGLYPGVVAML